MNIKNIINSLNLPNDEYIIIGVSAGPDSMALLHMLQNQQNKHIVCAHINHNLREESREEEEYLKKYCKSNNIIFEVHKISKYTTSNIENEARNKRYSFYEQLLKKYNSHTIFLAHHGDDLIETVLMKIARGSNIEGYAGIKMYSKVKDYVIVRPLLEVTKEDLIKYNKEHNIKYYIDKSNYDESYTRNRLRKNILPLLKKEDNNIHLKFLRYSNELQAYHKYVEETTNKIIKKIYINNVLDLLEFNKEHEFIKKNIIFSILINIYNEPNIIKNTHINSILKLTINKAPNMQVSLPQNYVARKEYNKLYIEKESNKLENYKILLKDEVHINNIVIKKVEDEDKDGNNICRLNSKKITLPLYVRNKLDGDTIEVLGLNGKKKIKEIFIENKIPSKERESYPILVDANNTILWIPNLKKSKYNVKKNEFYDIILTSYKEREEKNEENKK